ncbi:uncharacterized protein NPIL_386881 [Nephila pilipes]|uniref:Uncharacterized protein n=1 Tax=Nephila pilipes TaxID=299642 RepID=A0A8X6Q0A2_NEPPI|nr:uncharacterized protein NPIL_386881 [Nephila pilipes]
MFLNFTTLLVTLLLSAVLFGLNITEQNISLQTSYLRPPVSSTGMESNIAILWLCCLTAFSQGFSYYKSQTSYDSPPGNYLDGPTDQEAEFLRLLLSRYGVDSSNYADLDELYGENENSMLSNYEFPLDQEDAGNSMPPSPLPVQEFPGDKVATQEPAKENNVVTTPSTTTTDGLASVPPASREKGQKEYAMLRPPVDNHKKIEHWMKLMNENKLAFDRNAPQNQAPVP